MIHDPYLTQSSRKKEGVRMMCCQQWRIVETVSAKRSISIEEASAQAHKSEIQGYKTFKEEWISELVQFVISLLKETHHVTWAIDSQHND